jgi:hypothetical protein
VAGSPLRSAVAYRDRRWLARSFGPGMLVFFALLFMSAALASDVSVVVSVIGATGTVGSLWAAWRLRRVMAVFATTDGVTAFRMIGRYSWTWAVLDRFGAEVLSTFYYIVPRPILVVYLKDGSRKVLQNVTAGARDKKPTWIDDTADELNKQLARNGKREGLTDKTRRSPRRPFIGRSARTAA